jgi:hypothetical protein
MRTRLQPVAGVVLALGASVAAAADSNWGARVGGAYHAPNRDGLFYLAPSRHENLEEGFLTYAREGFYFSGTAYHRRADSVSRERGVVNELYLDTKWGEWDVTVGKKRLGWGVGFGFRPLDVIQPEPRRALIPPAPEGLPLLALEYFTAEHALTLLCGNDFTTGSGRIVSGGSECAVRYFRTAAGVDLEFVARSAEEVAWESGVDFTTVIGESLAWHGAALYQREYRKWINRLTESGGLLASADPMEQRSLEHGAKALLGGTYSRASGHSVMLELWYDRAGYSAEEWRRLRELTQAQRQLLGGALDAPARANIAASSRMLTQPSLLQKNVMLRWAYDDGESFNPALDLLYTPEDRGAVLTLSATHKLGASHTLNYGLRHYGGAEQALYRALPDQYIVYAVLRSTFNW